MKVSGNALKVVVPRVPPTRALEERERLDGRERERAAHSLHYLCLMRDDGNGTAAASAAVPTSIAAPAAAVAARDGAGERLGRSEAAVNKAAYLNHRYNAAPPGFSSHYPTGHRSHSNPPAGDAFDALQQRARTLVLYTVP